MRERDAVALLGWDGTPLSCHLMLTAGPRAAFGLLSPGDRPIERGDPFTVAFGIWGALNCRAGFVVEDADGLPRRRSATTSTAWSAHISPRSPSGTPRCASARPAARSTTSSTRRLGDPFFGIFLNPGHQIGLDEWVNSPIRPGSTIELRSGMAFQVDIIPATGTPYFTTNIEDGIALADALAAWRARGALSRCVGADRGAAGVHGRCARHRAAPRRPAVLEHPGLPAAVPAATRSGHDDRR